MLVLSRRVGETVVIGDGIEVIVSKVGGGRVHLAFKAPMTVPINRKEVLLRDKKGIEENGVSLES